jgi:cytochrome bd-type quinol oxidase subunit 2
MGFVWFWLVAIMLVAYVVLDGFDLGVAFCTHSWHTLKGSAAHVARDRSGMGRQRSLAAR